MARCELERRLRQCVLLFMAAVVGCGPTSQYPPLGRVGGVVTLDGQPVEGASVSFFPEQGRSSTSTTDAQGRYDLIYVGSVWGATIGSHRVAIQKVVQDPKYVPYPLEQSINDPGPKIVNLLPARFAGTKSELSAVVSKGKNTIDFHLESAK